MPDKWEYPWEACEPVLAVKSKRRATSKHYPVKKILKEGD
jgi:hypothetical protein